MKRIAVQENLYEIKEFLKAKGYDVVGFDDRGYINAIIYTDDYDGFRNINNDYTDGNFGAILINAKNKTIDEIEYIIETRRYSSLF
ncbi:MAG: YkuS family protein [Clostridiales bacterium]|nr:YkuS family protein [Clostridiales bacterium]